MFRGFADIEFNRSIWEQYVGNNFGFWFVVTDMIFHLPCDYDINLL